MLSRTRHEMGVESRDGETAAAVRFGEELLPLAEGEERQLRERRGLVGHRSREQDLQVIQQAPDGRAIEEVGPVLQAAADPPSLLRSEDEIEVRHLLAAQDRAPGEPGGGAL